MERPDPFQNRQNFEEIELTILAPNSEDSGHPQTEAQEASQDEVLKEQESLVPEASTSSDPPCEINVVPEAIMGNGGKMADKEASDLAMEEPVVESAIELPESITEPAPADNLVSTKPVDIRSEPTTDEVVEPQPCEIDMKDEVTPMDTNVDKPQVAQPEPDEVKKVVAEADCSGSLESTEMSNAVCAPPKADVGKDHDQEELPSSSVTLEHRHKRPRRKQAAPSSTKKKSRSGATTAGIVKDTRHFTTDWEKCLEDFYRESAWNGGSSATYKWAELKSKTIERGEAWMQPPVSLPTRYLAEFLQLMYSENPDVAPDWKILPSSLINVAAGSERRLQTLKWGHPLPLATPVIVNCRNETHAHYFLPLMLVAHTALKVIQNSIGIKRVAPPILKAASLDVITQCPTYSTHLLLLGYDPVPVSKLISLVCVNSWSKLESSIRKHVGEEFSRPARRKALRAREEELSDSEVSAIKNAVESCLQEIDDQRKLVCEALLPKPALSSVSPPMNCLASFCRAEKTYEAGDVVFRNVPCQMVLTYSAVLRLEVYKFLGIPPAMLEFEFDDLMQSTDSADVSDSDKSLMARAEALSYGSTWREMRKEHNKVLDQRIQIFMDFTLDRDQANWLMSKSESARVSKSPAPLSKASQMIANASLQTSPSEPESGYEANLSIDLNIDGVLKIPTSDKTTASSVDFGSKSDFLVNFVATRTIKGSDQLKLALGTQWRLVDTMYFSEE